MSLKSWLRYERWLHRQVPMRWLIFRPSPAMADLESAVLAGLTLVPLVVVWLQPFLLSSAAVLLGLIVAGAAWRALKLGSIRGWLAATAALVVYEGSVFVLWLFLENPVYRVLMLLAVAALGWWYLREWQRQRRVIASSERGAGPVPTLALGFVSAFALGSVAESFLVFLDTPLWILIIACYLPLVIQLIALASISDWPYRPAVRYVLTGAAVLLQIFLVATWWPTSFYVVGFTMAVVYAAIVLALRQEAQGFINRRSFGRELVVLGAAWAVVLATALWF